MSRKQQTKKPSDSFRDQPLTAELVQRLLQSVHKPLKIDDFLKILALPRRQKKTLESLLQDLAASGAVTRVAGGSYVLASNLKRATGVLSVQRSGVGFVKLDKPAGGEIFISQSHMGQAWHGDRVEVLIYPDSRGKTREGKIVSVLERAAKELAVRAVRNLKDGTVYCEPTDPRITAHFLVRKPDGTGKLAVDTLLRVAPGEEIGPNLWSAELLAVLGDENSSLVQEELVKANHAIPRVFPPDVLKQAASLPDQPGGESLEGRKDLTDIPFVTIDGADAKDFDDAVHVRRTKEGYTLLVAIADVAHYVRPGSALDAEAFLRGNSYYFPRSVEPMLPEALSNGLCSLKPDVPRLAMVAEMRFSAQGQPLGEQFYPALIRSRARLTYDQVRDALLDRQPDALNSLADNVAMLTEALDLARALAAVRREKGSLDFELPEPQCRFDEQGNLVDVVPRQHHFIHKLIEEFMVSANEAVARYLTRRECPVLYRVHPAPDPDKLHNLFVALSSVGLLPQGMSGKKTPAPSPAQLQALLDSARGTDHEYLISRVALRSMMQAGYSPDLEGHYGLASDCYCHFTSPIRRYADLVVHRSLKAALGTPDKTRLPGRKALQTIANHINATERTAQEAEREIYKRMSVIAMTGRVGETFSGVISGVTDFGIFVELDSAMAEGMVRLGEMRDDYYTYFPERHELRGERSGRVFRLGQGVEAVVTDVSLARLEINLGLPASGKGQAGSSARKPRPDSDGRGTRRRGNGPVASSEPRSAGKTRPSSRQGSAPKKGASAAGNSGSRSRERK